MKYLILVLVSISASSCAYKPPVLKSSNGEAISEKCIFLSRSVEGIQPINRVVAPAHHSKKDKIDYYFDLADFINTPQFCKKSFAKISAIKIRNDYQTYGKGKAYEKLIFDVQVEFVNGDGNALSKTYTSESKSNVYYFTIKDEKKYKLLSSALANGLNDIYNQVLTDLDHQRLKE